MQAMDAWVANKRVKRQGPKDKSFLSRKVTEGQENKFWINCNRRTKKGDLERGGRIQVSFEIVPLEQAEACEAGEGRSEPNVDPYLPPPIGRM
jgi:hypothetical protein